MAVERSEGTPVGRRVFLGMLGLGAAGIVWGSRISQGVSRALAPVGDIVPGGGAFRFYSVVDFSPSRSAADYRLTVGGLVDKPLTLTLADLQAMPSTRLVKDFQCVTGWRVPSVPWTGVRLADLLDAAGVRPTAKALTFRSFDGVYTESLTLDQARRPDVIVAHQMEDHPISQAHGGPVRMYVAPMYGYKSCKWLGGIEAVDSVEPGFWEERGYDVDGWIGSSNGRDDAPVT